jgi:hypothetical protein
MQSRRRKQLTPQDIRELRAELDKGIAEADRGEFVQFTAEDIIAEGLAAAERRKPRDGPVRRK